MPGRKAAARGSSAWLSGAWAVCWRSASASISRWICAFSSAVLACFCASSKACRRPFSCAAGVLCRGRNGMFRPAIRERIWESSPARFCSITQPRRTMGRHSANRKTVAYTCGCRGRPGAGKDHASKPSAPDTTVSRKRSCPGPVPGSRKSRASKAAAISCCPCMTCPSVTV